MTPSHFKTHAIFYAVAVSIVLGLFRLTSAYGEANLQAPPNINGRYLTSEAPPGCPDATRLVITVQQSGIYLNGALALTQLEPTAEVHRSDHLTLNGRWQEQLTLSGPTNAFVTCNLPAATEVTLQAMAQSSPEASLTGQLNIDSATSWSFTAQRQATPSQQSDH
jgi:hypothetical protein